MTEAVRDGREADIRRQIGWVELGVGPPGYLAARRVPLGPQSIRLLTVGNIEGDPIPTLRSRQVVLI